MQMSLSQLVSVTNGVLKGNDLNFSAVSTDTRSLAKGELYIALNGENFDGHDFVAKAANAGAAAIMVEHEMDEPIAQVVVGDTRLGLGLMANAWRKQVNPKVVALTGSNGKTTLKEMLAAIFAKQFDVLATLGNLNNDIGVPLTLLRLQQENLAVIEMGANHLQEIDYLSRMAAPDVAILNNAGLAHVGEFGSPENIARGKAEILNGLNADGIFVYHADSQWVNLWRELAISHKAVGFGYCECDYQLLENSLLIKQTAQGFMNCFDVVEKSTNTTHAFELQLAGRHNAVNAVAAIAAARQLDMPMTLIAEALAEIKPVAGRLNMLQGKNGQWLIDDTYNANPDSVKAAIDVLREVEGQTVLVIGDLAELGDQAETLMQELGIYAKAQGIDAVYACGQISKATVAAFGTGGKHFSDQQALIDSLNTSSSTGRVILVKGSRSAKMEKVVQALAATGGVAC